MEKDYRHEVVKTYILTGKIVHFKEIFKYFPRTILASYLHTNNNRLKRLADKPDELSYREMKFIAAYFDVKTSAIVRLIAMQVEGPGAGPHAV